MTKWQKLGLACIITVFALFYVPSFISAVSNDGSKPLPKSTASETISTAALYNLVNEERHTAGVPALSYSPELESTATDKCGDMVKYDYYDHMNPQTGISTYEEIGKKLPNSIYIAENLNKGDLPTNKGYVDSWMNSPAHKATMLDPKYSETGLALCQVPRFKDEVVIVEHFAEVKNPQPAHSTTSKSTIQNCYSTYTAPEDVGGVYIPGTIATHCN